MSILPVCVAILVALVGTVFLVAGIVATGVLLWRAIQRREGEVTLPQIGIPIGVLLAGYIGGIILICIALSIWSSAFSK